MRSRRLTKLLANLGLVASSTCVALLLFEAGVRLVRPQPLAAVARSARFGWTHKPNTDIVFEREEFRVPVHFSSFGLRDREYPLAKPPGTRRIAILGDSFVEALQVPLDSCMAKRLEARLGATRAGGSGWQVIDFGVSGYGTCQQLALLEEMVLQFQPDVVISQYYYNDLDDDRRYGACAFDADGRLQVAEPSALGLHTRLVSAAKSFLYQHSEGFVWLTNRSPRMVTLAPAAPQAAAPGPDSTAVPTCQGRHETLEWRLTLRDEPADARRAVELQAALWERMAAISRQHGARFLAVLGVSKTQLEPAVYAQTLATERCAAAAHDVELPAERLRAAAARRGVELVDLLPAFRAFHGPGWLHFRIDGHWNAAGHRVATEALYDALVQRGILTDKQPEGDR